MTKQAPPAITTPSTSSLLGPLPSIGNGTSFKSGSQLPSISNDKKPNSSLFPPTKKQEVVEDEDEEEYDDQYEEEEDEDDGDFDANELLNLTDYQNKRGKLNEKPAMLAASKPMNISKDDFEEEEEDNGWGDDWGAPKKQDLNNFDYKNTNLNKLSNEQIA
jgi:choline dehydrogenase-like flavoprotein